MPTLFFANGLRIMIYTRDHLPPHVVGPGFDIKVYLETFEAVLNSGRASAKMLKQASMLVSLKRELCWEAWNEIQEK